MKVLLDTHALIWWTSDSKKLGKKAFASIADFDNQVFVSAASAWEITTKFRLGKLPHAEQLARSFRDSVKSLGFFELAISIEHAQQAGLSLANHKDPFDRLLIAQSQAENFPLISNEKLFDRFLVHRIW